MATVVPRVPHHGRCHRRDPVKWQRVFVRGIALAATWLCSAAAGAHELQANRLTLILHDARHVAFTFYLDYGLALQAALAPRDSYAGFVARCATMASTDFAQELARAQASFEAGTVLFIDGHPVTIVNWRWPPAEQVQARLREQVMRAIAAPQDHGHEEPLEVHAEAVAARRVDAVRVRLPKEFGRVLVVAYRPSQRWVDPQALSPPIRF